MAGQDDKARMRRIPEDIFSHGRLDAADELFAVDYVEHFPIAPGFPAGVAGFKAFVAALREAFPDLQLTIEDEVTEGDRVVQRITSRGTMQGAFLGMPPTGKQATWTEMHIVRVADGKLVEHWGCIDQLGMLRQLGVIPMPG
jgi:steroid delta-isomerase-like uncharacterized protein